MWTVTDTKRVLGWCKRAQKENDKSKGSDERTSNPRIVQVPRLQEGSRGRVLRWSEPQPLRPLQLDAQCLHRLRCRLFKLVDAKLRQRVQGTDRRVVFRKVNFSVELDEMECLLFSTHAAKGIARTCFCGRHQEKTNKKKVVDVARPWVIVVASRETAEQGQQWCVVTETLEIDFDDNIWDSWSFATEFSKPNSKEIHHEIHHKKTCTKEPERTRKNRASRMSESTFIDTQMR